MTEHSQAEGPPARDERSAPALAPTLRALLVELDELRARSERDRGLVDALLEQTTHGVITCDLAGRLTPNRAAERIWAAGPAVSGIGDWDRYKAFHPDGRPFAPGDWSMARALRTGEAVDPEYVTIERFDGTRAIILAGAAPIRGADGAIQGAIGVFADVTELKRAEETALALERRARAEAEAANARSAFLSEASALLASSLDYEATLASVARLAVPGIADWCAVDLADEFWRGAPSAVVAHADPARVERARELQRRLPIDREARHWVPEVLRTGRPELYRELDDDALAAMAESAERLAAAQELGIRSAMVVPMRARGRVLGTITFVSAIPGRHGPADLQMAEHLARRAGLAIDNALLYREAQQAIRAREEVLAFVSHDLKNPLSAVAMSAALLERGGVDPRQARYVAAIRRSAERMDRLIHDLLDLSSIEAGRFRVERRPAEAPPLLADAAAFAQPLAAEKGVRVEVEADPATPPVLADRDRILQVLSNLVGNAIAFTPPGGRVTLRCSGRAASVLFAVADTGKGISEEDRPRVFDRFWKSEDSHQGSGLGLAIARGIVEAHGGRLWFETQPGAGTTFLFEVAAAPARAFGAGGGIP